MTPLEVEAKKVANILAHRTGPCVVCGGPLDYAPGGPPNHTSFNCPAVRLMLLSDACTLEVIQRG